MNSITVKFVKTVIVTISHLNADQNNHQKNIIKVGTTIILEIAIKKYNISHKNNKFNKDSNKIQIVVDLGLI